MESVKASSNKVGPAVKRNEDPTATGSVPCSHKRGLKLGNRALTSTDFNKCASSDVKSEVFTPLDCLDEDCVKIHCGTHKVLDSTKVGEKCSESHSQDVIQLSKSKKRKLRKKKIIALQSQIHLDRTNLPSAKCDHSVRKRTNICVSETNTPCSNEKVQNSLSFTDTVSVAEYQGLSKAAVTENRDIENIVVTSQITTEPLSLGTARVNEIKHNTSHQINTQITLKKEKSNNCALSNNNHLTVDVPEKTTNIFAPGSQKVHHQESDVGDFGKVDIFPSKTIDIPLFKSVLRGPIYTSPNLENRVTDSSQSNQLLKSVLELPEEKDTSYKVSGTLIETEKSVNEEQFDKCVLDKAIVTATCDVIEIAEKDDSFLEIYRSPTEKSNFKIQLIETRQETEISQKMEKSEKSRKDVLAEREAKKLAKQAKKAKSSAPQSTQAAQSKTQGQDETDRCLTAVSETSTVIKNISVPAKPPILEEKQKEKINNNVNMSEKIVESNQGSSDSKQSGGKSKAELRAERRAKQEAQRAAKQQQQAPEEVSKNKEPVEKKEEVKSDTKLKTQSVKKDVTKKPEEHRVKLFNHLYHQQYSSTTHNVSDAELHPAIIRLGIQYESKVVVGSNARCLALLDALKQVVEDYKTPPQKEFARDLEATLHPYTTYLQSRRPLAVSMTNALRYVKWQLTQLPNNISDDEAKKKLHDAIDTYIREQVEVAGLAICNSVMGKISSGDTILTYGSSSLIQRILIKAHESGTKFRVVIVDGCPWREGKEMLRRLVKSGIKCSYVLLTAASFIMREVTKVLLGAHALLANGYVMSRSGSSQVALLAHSCNVPVLVCCETHKFCERVQTDSFVYNEIGNPDELVSFKPVGKASPAVNWREISYLTPLNLTYDVTPPDLVTAVVTELAILPCTSVPVILRIKPSESGC